MYKWEKLIFLLHTKRCTKTDSQLICTPITFKNSIEYGLIEIPNKAAINNYFDIVQDEGLHRELKEKTEFVLHNISHGLKNMDKVRLRIRDKQDKPITFKQVPKR